MLNGENYCFQPHTHKNKKSKKKKKLFFWIKILKYIFDTQRFLLLAESKV